MSECPICFEQTTVGAIAPCGHRLCKGCYDGMKERGRDTCHLCQGPMESFAPRLF